MIIRSTADTANESLKTLFKIIIFKNLKTSQLNKNLKEFQFKK